MKSFLVALLLWSAVGAQAQTGATAPSQESPKVHRTAPSSVDAGDYIYISAQGPRGTDGALPSTFAAQARQTLNNLKSVVEAAGLTMDHVVYITVYLTDMNQYARDEPCLQRILWENSAGFGQCSALPRFPIPQLKLMQSQCAISRTGGLSIPRTTNRTSLFRRAFSLMIVYSFLPCRLGAKLQTILQLRWSSRLTE